MTTLSASEARKRLYNLVDTVAARNRAGEVARGVYETAQWCIHFRVFLQSWP
jgi:hypothetical protein